MARRHRLENIIEGGVTLSERLRQRIALEGPISFRDFMEAALYEPEEGYYSKGAPIGEGGDFATSPSITPLFARTIARRFRRDMEGFEGTIDFVEAGAGGGEMLAELFAEISRTDPALAARVRLTAVERGKAGLESLARLGLPGLRVLPSAAELARRSVRGWIFSNELYDALPVFRVRAARNGGLEEMRVTAASEGFRWVFASPVEDLRRQLEDAGAALAPGQVAEVCPEAAALHRALAGALERGCLVAFDYGHRSRTLYHSLARPNGTLAVHSGGRRHGDPLARPGDVDLTAHVNWDSLVRAGEEEGLKPRDLPAGLLAGQAGPSTSPGRAEKWRAFYLVDPEGMGEELSVLVQKRGESASGAHH